jgi:flavin reductase (DIM6/NTAB) family NADH-FMN oxidoreductase RutF
MTPQIFKQLMRLHPAAVNIIATGSAPHRTGLTATAFMSLGAVPPAIVCAVNRSSYSYQQLTVNQAFSVNTLSLNHIEQAQIFSGQKNINGDERFASEAWGAGTIGVPVLLGAVISLECRLVRQFEESTHCLMVGEVLAGHHKTDAQPLLYCDGQWMGLTQAEAA